MAAPQVAQADAPAHAPLAQRQAAERVLYRLTARDWNSRWLARSARLFGWVMTGYSSVPYLLIGSKAQVLGRVVIWENLVTLSWLAGFAALVVAAPVSAASTADLARLRGVTPTALARIDWAAACAVPFKVLAPAGLVMSTLATVHASSWSDVGRSLLTVIAVAGYLLIAAGTLGLTALWARRLSPNRGRTLFTLVILIPMLLEHAQVMSSIPTVLNDLLRSCLSLASST